MNFCTNGKTIHRSILAAEAVLHQTAERPISGKRGHSLEIYECDECGFWHIGNKSKKKKKAWKK